LDLTLCGQQHILVSFVCHGGGKGNAEKSATAEAPLWRHTAPAFAGINSGRYLLREPPTYDYAGASKAINPSLIRGCFQPTSLEKKKKNHKINKSH